MFERKPLMTFIIFVFLISWPLFLVPLAFDSADEQIRQMITMVAFALGDFDPNFTMISEMLPASATSNPILIIAMQVGSALTVATIFNSILRWAKNWDGVVFCFPSCSHWGNGKRSCSANSLNYAFHRKHL